MDKQDRDLGMDCDITRKDFIEGVAVAVTGAIVASKISPAAAAAPVAAAGENYPPMRTGLRGFDQGAIDAGHALRDGKAFDAGADTGETYDMVVVGAGMAGLSAAYFYRKQIPNAKVLVLEGCDDFGGHARRNEFNADGRQILAPGGAMAISGFDTYSTESQTLLRDIGIDPDRWRRYSTTEKFAMREMGLRPATFYPKERHGVDRLVSGTPPMSADRATWSAFLAQTPFTENAKAGLLKLYTEKTDYMPGLSAGEKVSQLKKMSYIDYLLKVANIHPDAVAYVQSLGGHYMNNQAAGPDTYSAWFAYRYPMPGFGGLGLPAAAQQTSNLLKTPGVSIGLPDGNGGAARLLVRWLIPDALPGATMEDSVAAHVRYDTLDRPANEVRIRLSSTVIRVRHLGDPLTAKEVEITYLREGRPLRVKAGAVVMACFNAVVPYLVPELPEPQKAALHMAVRKPLIQANVAIRNWRAFAKLGVSNISCPGMFYHSISPIQRAAMGDYKNPQTPDEPIGISMPGGGTFVEKHGSGLPPREQWKAARYDVLNTSFETYERHLRDQLERVLGPGGFSARRDIAGIIINRWGHAYAGGSNELYDPDWSHRADAPWVIGRQRFGRITISNSDAAATSLTQAAMMQSHRAVNEILTNIVRPVYDFHFSERDTAGEPGDYPNNF